MSEYIYISPFVYNYFAVKQHGATALSIGKEFIYIVFQTCFSNPNINIVSPYAMYCTFEFTFVSPRTGDILLLLFFHFFFFGSAIIFCFLFGYTKIA